MVPWILVRPYHTHTLLYSTQIEFDTCMHGPFGWSVPIDVFHSTTVWGVRLFKTVDFVIPRVYNNQ